MKPTIPSIPKLFPPLRRSTLAVLLALPTVAPAPWAAAVADAPRAEVRREVRVEVHDGGAAAPAPASDGARVREYVFVSDDDHSSDPPEAAPRPRRFLGVETSGVPEPLTHQLGLPEGIGLVVEEVLPDTPAAAAGVQRHDVLVRLEDQHLVSAAQLGVLLQMHRAGDPVRLTVVRSGKEQVLTATLVERDVPAPRRSPRAWWFGDEGTLAPLPPGTFGGLEHDELMRSVEEAMRGAREAQRRYRAPGEAHLAPPGAPTAPPPPATPAVPRSTILHLSNADSVYSDGEHTLLVRRGDGGRTLTAKDARGVVLFEGPIDQPEDLQRVPAELRAKLDELDRELRVEPPAAPVPPRVRLAPPAGATGVDPVARSAHGGTRADGPGGGNA